jgi:hypothetical protein
MAELQLKMWYIFREYVKGDIIGCHGLLDSQLSTAVTRCDLMERAIKKMS